MTSESSPVFNNLSNEAWKDFIGANTLKPLEPEWLGGLQEHGNLVQRSALCRFRRELSNEYLLAKFSFDTAENEPCKNFNFLTFLTPEF